MLIINVLQRMRIIFINKAYDYFSCIFFSISGNNWIYREVNYFNLYFKMR